MVLQPQGALWGICFVWLESIEAAVPIRRGWASRLSPGPVDRIGAAGQGQSVYCRDPDGSLIELISYA